MAAVGIATLCFHCLYVIIYFKATVSNKTTSLFSFANEHKDFS